MLNWRPKQFIVALLIFSALSGVLAVPASASTGEVKVMGPHRNYIVRLNTANPEVLSAFAVTVEKQFPSASTKNFDNVYSFTSAYSLEYLKNGLGNQVDYVEEDSTIISDLANPSALPDDPGFTTNGSNIDRQWGLVKAEFIDAWKLTTGSRDVIVAVIDTGIDASHEDFDSRSIINGYNVITEKTITRRQNSDDNGHGTLVAGVIGANTDNNRGIAGAAWNVTLMPVKALNAKGSGRAAQLSEAIVWSADNGANIINLSLGGLGFAHNTTLANAITHAYEKNVVIVAAAGNDVAITGGNLDVDPVFPICNDNGKNMIIGVTATDVNDLKPSFANYGKACVDVSAPGRRILSTINHDPATGALSPDSYAYASGTSLAVPYVSAQAALLKALYPFASNSQIRDRIIATADNIDSLNLSQCAAVSCVGFLGKGRINVAKSLEEQIVRFIDGDVVRISGTDTLYYINGGKRQYISPFVRNQRFAAVSPITATMDELLSFPEGSYAEPTEGTLIKIANEGTVFYMSNGLRLPVTYQVFVQRGFNFNNVHNLSNIEVNSWILGSFLAPLEGTLVRTSGNPTVYWTLNGSLHPINEKYWVEKGLSIFPVIYISEEDLAGYPKGDPFVL